MKFVQLICLFARDIAADIAIRLNQPPKEKFPKKNPLCVNFTQESKLSIQKMVWFDESAKKCRRRRRCSYYCYWSNVSMSTFAITILLFCVHLFHWNEERAVFHFSLTFHLFALHSSRSGDENSSGLSFSACHTKRICVSCSFIISLFFLLNWFGDQFATWNQFYSE